MRWLGLAIVACVVALLAPAPAQTPGPQSSPTASPEPVIEITVGPQPNAVSGTIAPSASPSATSTPSPRSRRGSRSRTTPAPSLLALPSPSASPVASVTPLPERSVSPASTYKPIFYHGIPIYPKPGYGLPSEAVPLVPAAPSPTPSKASATVPREKYYWGVPTPEAIVVPLPSPSPLRLRTPLPVRAAASAQPVDDALLDRSAMLIGGVWSCMSFGGTQLYHRYVRSDDGISFDATTTFVLAKHKIGRAKETYRFKHRTLLWHASLAGGSIVADAPPWIGVTWTFSGSARDEDQKVSGFRMIYTLLGDNVFRRDFERLDDVGAWSVYAGETCRRAAQTSI